MSSLYRSIFWKDASERAVKTAAQAGILAIGASEGFDLFSLNWKSFVGFAAGGAFLSILMSVASAGVGDNESASLVKGVK